MPLEDDELRRRLREKIQQTKGSTYPIAFALTMGFAAFLHLFLVPTRNRIDLGLLAFCGLIACLGFAYSHLKKRKQNSDNGR
jgi:hypothetical protein